MANILKNIPFDTPLALGELVNYQEGQVVSRTLVQNRGVGLTLFAFDAEEQISSHSSTGDALVHILDGRARITVGERVHVLEKGQALVMPAGIPHALWAETPFKMLLTVVFPPKATE